MSTLVTFNRPCPKCDKFEAVTLVDELPLGKCEAHCTDCDESYLTYYEVDDNAAELV